MAICLALSNSPSRGASSLDKQVKPTLTNPVNASNQDVPDYVKYDFFFRRVIFIKEQEVKLQIRNETTPIQREANLDVEQMRALEEIAATCLAEVRQQDAIAREIIQEFRARFPKGIVSKNQPPPPPSELETMQQSRNAMILRARGKIKLALGEQAFEQIDKYVKTSISVRRNNLD
ncbi:MAG: hypothetical protein HOP19_27970 [Acidobacteria bacterium]|nr:hypothetical protein [Acidobacteriota bacterium]